MILATAAAPALARTTEPAVVPAIEVAALNFRYPSGSAGLSDVSFRVDAGECVALVGPNGAGKSTLLLHLNGLLPERHESSGAVQVFGQKVTRANVHQIRRQVGLLFQNADDQLFCPTVFEDVAFGPRQHGLDEQQVGARVRDCLARVGLAGFEQRSPNRLSGGEKRRACLAAVLACEPRVLVLDEPTSDLDPRGRREFKALLASLPVTKIIATHDLELALEQCPRALVLDGGKLVAQGPTGELFADEPLMLAHGLETPTSLRGSRRST